MKKILHTSITKYQKYISPLFPDVCKYYPSCSAYAEIALRTLPLFSALKLILGRLLRCNPFSNGGVDFPPEPYSIRFSNHVHPNPELIQKSFFNTKQLTS
jgi:putative membrane protein insertion efficiency factor